MRGWLDVSEFMDLRKHCVHKMCFYREYPAEVGSLGGTFFIGDCTNLTYGLHQNNYRHVVDVTVWLAVNL